ncbi:DNA polymerase/3'-5' exonuclease PolX [Lacisediminimonas profundi]|uniref:DNA polymerase/3'-5' exonuclease PolX n=1 Tax=Lacisediminimonas profundi TaxID=2603856 RepID=UPI00124B4768|nr:DNA polymerase/3'-5' exonuclease PolX [Lacisediminimonas profundi]
MLVHNSDIAEIFSEIADMLEIQDANPFRVRAYRNAARLLQSYAPNLQTMLQQGQPVPHLPGIGTDLMGKIREIADHGTCALRDQLRRELPPGLRQLLAVPGIGPRRAKLLHEVLGVDSLEQLADACREGTVAGLRGMGTRGQQRILQAVEDRLSKSRRFGIALATELADTLVRHLRASDAQAKVEVAGSFRRGRETVGDLDLVASSSRPTALIAAFAAFDGVGQVLAKGSTRASVVLRQGIQVDLRVVAPVSFGAALHYFTGSREHNIALRGLARRNGLKINEYGVFSAEERIAGETEASVFKAVGLPWIAPELRENRGEIEAAQQEQLPDLVQLSDLKGDLHVHTRSSDGRNSLREMALAAQQRGLDYIAITDHSSSLAVAGGLDADGLARQIDDIDALNAELHGIVLLKGIEAEIRVDGSFDLPDDLLRRLDLVVGAVHSKMDLPSERQTARILKAMDHPCFTLLAHPSGRLLGEREPYALDMNRVIRHARERGCFLEVNSQPSRLDLNDQYCMQARREGVMVAIDSDAHSVLDFDNLRFGIAQARRGWTGPDNVLNARSLTALRKLLLKARG